MHSRAAWAKSRNPGGTADRPARAAARTARAEAERRAVGCTVAPVVRTPTAARPAPGGGRRAAKPGRPAPGSAHLPGRPFGFDLADPAGHNVFGCRDLVRAADDGDGPLAGDSIRRVLLRHVDPCARPCDDVADVGAAPADDARDDPVRKGHPVRHHLTAALGNRGAAAAAAHAANRGRGRRGCARSAAVNHAAQPAHRPVHPGSYSRVAPRLRRRRHPRGRRALCRELEHGVVGLPDLLLRRRLSHPASDGLLRTVDGRHGAADGDDALLRGLDHFGLLRHLDLGARRTLRGGEVRGGPGGEGGKVSPRERGGEGGSWRAGSVSSTRHETSGWAGGQEAAGRCATR
eukprot:scaffold1375_cov96-Isochrysis_galbana.AAC.10